jgi:hypothetical protein
MSFDFVSYIRKRADGNVYITIPAPAKEKAPIDAAVKVHVDVVLEKQVKPDESKQE